MLGTRPYPICPTRGTTPCGVITRYASSCINAVGPASTQYLHFDADLETVGRLSGRHHHTQSRCEVVWQVYKLSCPAPTPSCYTLLLTGHHLRLQFLHRFELLVPGLLLLFFAGWPYLLYSPSSRSLAFPDSFKLVQQLLLPGL